MQNTFKAIIAALVLSAAVLVVPSYAVYVPPQTSGEISLQEILDKELGAGVINLAITDSVGGLFKALSPTALLIEEIAGFKDSNILSWYNPSDPSDGDVIFVGPDSPGSPEEVFAPSNPFGFSLHTPTQTFFSQTGLNIDGYEHFWAFYNPKYGTDQLGRKQYIVAVEDYVGGFDGDHNDMVFSVIGVTPVPEPGTLMLLGSGLIGALGFVRRFRLS